MQTHWASANRFYLNLSVGASVASNNEPSPICNSVYDFPLRNLSVYLLYLYMLVALQNPVLATLLDVLLSVLNLSLKKITWCSVDYNPTGKRKIASSVLHCFHSIFFYNSILELTVHNYTAGLKE